MVGPNVDDIDYGSFFDQIDDILDFPNEEVDVGLELPEEKCDVFPKIWPTQPDSFLDANSVFTCNTAADLSTQLSLPHEDIVQLEWLSKFVEDSFSGVSLTINNVESSSINKDSSLNQFQTSSPVSVLESSSSCSGEKIVPQSPEAVAPGRNARARSKRPRPATFNPRMTVQLTSLTSSVFEGAKVPSDSENFAESSPLFKVPNQANVELKNKKKVKMSSPSGAVETTQSQAVRKCAHCEITKTPQWRAGPMGPKTLCNACGVRYKSGRLFPEYRPAASPTFVPFFHSNSHKKVIEMRNKVGEIPPMTETETTMTTSAELIPNSTTPQLDHN